MDTTGVVAGETINHTIKINNENKFGKQKVAGLQQKGLLSLNGDIKFAKLDTLSPLQKGNWKPQFDFRYSSVAEAMTSCLTRHIKDPDNINGQMVDYKFKIFQLKNKQVSGTISDDFLSNPHDVELNLGINSDIKHGFLNNQQYADEVVDCTAENRLNNLTNHFTKLGMDENKAKQFLIQQAGLDIITGNTDRLKNPGNFTLIRNVKTQETRPLNMDYGRCLSMPSWSDTMESNYDFKADFHQEVLDDTSDELIHQNTSIAKSFSIKDSIKFLKGHNFKPIKIDMQKFKKDLHQLDTQIQQSDLPFKKFAHMKCEAFSQVMDNPDIKSLYQDTSLNINLDGLSNNQKPNQSI